MAQTALRMMASGVAGAGALTLVHEIGRRVRPDAPRMDVLGMRALAASMAGAGIEPPPERPLHTLTLAGDLLANSVYYAAIPASTRAATWARAAVLGLGAGIGALVLPRRMGLGDAPHSTELPNQVMTVAWYVVGALAAAVIADALHARPAQRIAGAVV
jgi:uncharacterized membrane protein YhhN